jgi:hypothetical protein
MTLWAAIAKVFAARRIDSRAALKEFLETRAAYLVQKSTAEYCQARAGIGFSTLLTERAFQEALERTKWRGYPAGFSMVGETVAGSLRAVAAAGLIETHIVSLARDVFGAFPLPKGEAPRFWAIAEEALAADLARAALGQPKPAHAIAQARAQEIFDALPMHQRLRTHDFEMFRNTLRFHLTEISAEFEERADLAALAAAIGAA